MVPRESSRNKHMRETMRDITEALIDSSVGEKTLWPVSFRSSGRPGSVSVSTPEDALMGRGKGLSKLTLCIPSCEANRRSGHSNSERKKEGTSEKKVGREREKGEEGKEVLGGCESGSKELSCRGESDPPQGASKDNLQKLGEGKTSKEASGR